ncbi:MAG: hypothetical protein FD161_2428 [Limisphaerales bacterium]|nr:MAG: hypothetical protein FD161_2428 [Limisphaerales bacterium]KAG0508645.1 MAG: hypothetical protein E1N63_2179 [Limisphaerales bacterium]TXT48718.1 MAG: hypothetical protein FD140_3504 [Limisphaerales bacterium]
MAAPLPFAESEIRLLTALLKARVRFMVVGLSAATMQGAPVVTQDVDLWFEKLGDPQISQALQTVGAAYVPPSNFNPPMLAGTGAELFDIVLRMDGLGPFASELKHCVNVPLGLHKLKVLSLERILVSKLAANRAKDRLTISVLRDALTTTTAVKPPARKRKPNRPPRCTRP